MWDGSTTKTTGSETSPVDTQQYCAAGDSSPAPVQCSVRTFQRCTVLEPSFGGSFAVAVETPVCASDSARTFRRPLDWRGVCDEPYVQRDVACEFAATERELCWPGYCPRAVEHSSDRWPPAHGSCDEPGLECDSSCHVDLRPLPCLFQWQLLRQLLPPQPWSGHFQRDSNSMRRYADG